MRSARRGAALLLAGSLACAGSAGSGPEASAGAEPRPGATAGAGGAAAAPATPAGVVWQLERIQMMDDTEKRPEDPSRYTLELLPDGSAAVRADCNRGRGSYALDGSRLTFGPLATTRAMCPPGSLSDAYLQQLAIAASWMIVEGRLAIATAMDSSILYFAPAP